MENPTIEEEITTSSIVEKLIDENKNEQLLNFSQLIDEKASHQSSEEDKFEWKVFVKPKRIKQIKQEIENKRQRLEHCKNFIMEDEICEENGKVYIKSPGKENWYLDVENDSNDVKMLFYDFWRCLQDKNNIPDEIETLESMLEFLDS